MLTAPVVTQLAQTNWTRPVSFQSFTYVDDASILQMVTGQQSAQVFGREQACAPLSGFC